MCTDHGTSQEHLALSGETQATAAKCFHDAIRSVTEAVRRRFATADAWAKSGMLLRSIDIGEELR